MTKTTLEVDGMMCGMCESHVNEVYMQKHHISFFHADLLHHILVRMRMQFFIVHKIAQ